MPKEIGIEDFRASDIYGEWRKYCQKAKSSIQILSPSIDGIVLHLLTSKKIQKSVSKTIYTRIDEITLLSNPKQITALKRCLEIGVEVRMIGDLNASILKVDNDIISMGTQGFTSGSRKTKEASYVSNVSFRWSFLLDEVNNWIENAEKVDYEYLCHLEHSLAENSHCLKKQYQSCLKRSLVV